MSWEAYVHLAFDEIRMAGAGSPQVSRRLKAALDDLRSIAPPDRVAVLDEQLDLLAAATERPWPTNATSRWPRGGPRGHRRGGGNASLKLPR